MVEMIHQEAQWPLGKGNQAPAALSEVRNPYNACGSIHEGRIDLEVIQGPILYAIPKYNVCGIAEATPLAFMQVLALRRADGTCATKRPMSLCAENMM